MMDGKSAIERFFSLEVISSENGLLELSFARYGRFNSIESAEIGFSEIREKHPKIEFAYLREIISDRNGEFSNRMVKTIIRADFEKKDSNITGAEMKEIIKEQQMRSLNAEILYSENVGPAEIFNFVDRAFKIGKGEFK